MDLITRAFAATTNTPSFSNLSISFYTGSNSVAALAGTIATWISGIAGIVAFFYLIYSGFLYLTAAGNPDNAKKGQQGIIYAIIGIVIIILAYTIITAIIGTLA